MVIGKHFNAKTWQFKISSIHMVFIVDDLTRWIKNNINYSTVSDLKANSTFISSFYFSQSPSLKFRLLQLIVTIFWPIHSFPITLKKKLFEFLKSYTTCSLLNISSLDSLILYLWFARQFFSFCLSYFFKLVIGKIITWLLSVLTQDKKIYMNIVKLFNLETFHLLQRLLLDLSTWIITRIL